MLQTTRKRRPADTYTRTHAHSQTSRSRARASTFSAHVLLVHEVNPPNPRAVLLVPIVHGIHITRSNQIYTRSRCEPRKGGAGCALCLAPVQAVSLSESKTAKRHRALLTPIPLRLLDNRRDHVSKFRVRTLFLVDLAKDYRTVMLEQGPIRQLSEKL